MNSRILSKSRVTISVMAALLLATSSCSRRPIRVVSTRPLPTASHSISMPSPTVIVRTKTLPLIDFPDLNTDEISDLKFSPDGRRLAFGYGTDAEVSLWNLETGKLSWQRHVDAASGGFIQFGPHGRFLVAQFSDPDGETPIIVCTVGGQLIRNLGNFQDGGNATLEKSGRYLVTGGSREGIVKGRQQWDAVKITDVWDTHIWRRVDHIFTAPTGFVPLTASGIIIRHPTLEKTSGLMGAYGEPAEKWWKHVEPSIFGEENEYTFFHDPYFVRLMGMTNKLKFGICANVSVFGNIL